MALLLPPSPPPGAVAPASLGPSARVAVSGLVCGRSTRSVERRRLRKGGTSIAAPASRDVKTWHLTPGTWHLRFSATLGSRSPPRLRPRSRARAPRSWTPRRRRGRDRGRAADRRRGAGCRGGGGRRGGGGGLGRAGPPRAARPPRARAPRDAPPRRGPRGGRRAATPTGRRPAPPTDAR